MPITAPSAIEAIAAAARREVIRTRGDRRSLDGAGRTRGRVARVCRRRELRADLPRVPARVRRPLRGGEDHGAARSASTADGRARRQAARVAHRRPAASRARGSARGRSCAPSSDETSGEKSELIDGIRLSRKAAGCCAPGRFRPAVQRLRRRRHRRRSPRLRSTSSRTASKISSTPTSRRSPMDRPGTPASEQAPSELERRFASARSRRAFYLGQMRKSRPSRGSRLEAITRRGPEHFPMIELFASIPYAAIGGVATRAYMRNAPPTIPMSWCRLACCKKFDCSSAQPAARSRFILPFPTRHSVFEAKRGRSKDRRRSTSSGRINLG